MLCVPRSWAASPWVIERMTVILSAIWAVCGSVSLNSSPSILVWIEPISPRYSIGANGLGSNDLLVGDAARQEDVDDRLGLRLNRVVVLQLGLGLPHAEEVAQRQAAAPPTAPTVKKPRRDNRLKCAGSQSQLRPDC